MVYFAPNASLMFGSISNCIKECMDIANDHNYRIGKCFVLLTYSRYLISLFKSRVQSGNIELKFGGQTSGVDKRVWRLL